MLEEKFPKGTFKQIQVDPSRSKQIQENPRQNLLGSAWFCLDLLGSVWFCLDLLRSAWICVICLDLLGSAEEGAMKVQFIYILYKQNLLKYVDLHGSAWICRGRCRESAVHIYGMILFYVTFSPNKAGYLIFKDTFKIIQKIGLSFFYIYSH